MTLVAYLSLTIPTTMISAVVFAVLGWLDDDPSARAIIIAAMGFAWPIVGIFAPLALLAHFTACWVSDVMAGSGR